MMTDAREFRIAGRNISRISELHHPAPIAAQGKLAPSAFSSLHGVSVMDETNTQRTYAYHKGSRIGSDDSEHESTLALVTLMTYHCLSGQLILDGRFVSAARKRSVVLNEPLN